MKKNFESLNIVLDYFLIISTALFLVFSIISKNQIAEYILVGLSILGLLPVLQSALKDLFSKKLTVDLLASIALIFSFLAGEWFSAAFITLMLASARLFDQLTEQRSKNTIRSLLKYNVEKVRLLKNDSILEVSIKEIKVGDLVSVDSGDRIPVDGIVVKGEATVDESSLTGESELINKAINDRVFTSTINESGSIIVKATHLGKDTTLARMIALVDQAGREKNQAERSADRFATWYISASLLVAIAMYVFGLDVKEILAVLLVVCADDIAVAVPLAFTIAIYHAAKRGVVIKGSAVVEQLAKLKYIFTDKTGTLTKGKPVIVEAHAYEPYSKQEIIKKFALGSSQSNHAVSKAIKSYAGSKHFDIHVPDKFNEVPGQGILLQEKGEMIVMGRLNFLEKNGSTITEQQRTEIAAEKNLGLGITMLAVNGKLAGFMTYRDELRPFTKIVIDETKILGVDEWHMLTGDNEKSASNVSKEIGIDHFHSNLSPEDKVNYLRKFKSELRAKNDNGVIGYIGDGVNDAASLALADVSIAMGGIGADAAIEAADMTIMKDKLSRLPEMMMLAQKTQSIMKGNYWIWGITNAVGLLLVFSGYLDPAGAAAYNFLTDFIPIANAFRANTHQHKFKFKM